MFTRLSDLRSKLEHRKGSFEGTASEVHNFELAGRWYKQKQRIIVIIINNNNKNYNNINNNNNKIM